jgi:hypothetical protein
MKFLVRTSEPESLETRAQTQTDARTGRVALSIRENAHACEVQNLETES